MTFEVYKYLNYRRLLAGLLEFHRAEFGLTLRQFADRAGFSSHAYLTQLINGTRTASLAAVPKLARGFELDERQEEYLELLVKFDLAESLEEKNAVYKKITKLKPRDKLARIEKNQFKAFSMWYVFAVRELVTLPDFQNDPGWIATKLVPNITKKEAAEAVKLLLETGFLKEEQDGRLVQTDPVLTTGAETGSFFIINYHTNLLGLAGESMYQTSEDWRDISSLGFLIDRDEFQYLKSRIVDFRAELLQYIQDRQNEFTDTDVPTDRALYYLNMQLFNASALNWKKPPSNRQAR